MSAIVPIVLPYVIKYGIPAGTLLVGWVGGWFHHKRATMIPVPQITQTQGGQSK